ncbi:MAG: tRNA uridine-5-carboxymethylaminomethyl(34) synthesis enzyme MnmG, partial [Nitrospirae bacterium]
KGYRAGLVTEDVYEEFLRKKEALERELNRLSVVKVSPEEANPVLRRIGSSEITEKTTLEQLLKRPEVTYSTICEISPPEEVLPAELENLIHTEVKYKGYIQRQLRQVERMKRMEERLIPEDFNYDSVAGLSKEVLTKLKEIRPRSIGQAMRIPGVTPAAVSLLLIALERQKRQKDYNLKH